MTLTIPGDAVMARPFHPINSIEFHQSNILTSASFTPPPRKSLLQRLIEYLNRSIQP